MGSLGEWLGENAWVAWAVAAGLLAVIEVLTLDLVFLMLAAGAASGAVAAAIGLGGPISIIVAIVVSVGMLAAVRPVALRHLKQGSGLKTGVEALVGSKALVIEQVDAHHGQVKIGGELWSARSYDEHSVIEPGTSVDVMSIDGATAYVFDVDRHLES